MKDSAIATHRKKLENHGIRELIRNAGNIRLTEFSLVYDQMSSRQFGPKINVSNYKKLRRGGKAKIRIQGYPLNEVDYYNGRFKAPGKNGPGKSILACWRTADGQSVRPLKHQKDDLYTVDIPEDSVDGLLVFLFPVVERFGSAKIAAQYPKEIKNWIGGFEYTDMGRQKQTKQKCDKFHSSGTRERYYAYIFPYHVKFPCYDCVIDCPKDAIEINAAGHCRIDPEKCDGQKYSKNATGDGRGEEEICWNCFNSQDGTISSKCDQVTLRKVLHMNPDPPRTEGPCCGKCGVDEMCPEGALNKVGVGYSGDKSACNGCMNCYYHHPYGYCLWNCGTYCSENCDKWEDHEAVPLNDGEGGSYTKNIHGNYTMRMVSEIDYKGLIVVRKARAFWHVYGPDPGNIGRPEYVGVWGDKFKEVPIKFDSQGNFSFNMMEVPFSKSAHFALLDGNKQLFDFQHCGMNLPIKSIGGKRYRGSRSRTQGGTLRFKTRTADFELEYEMR